jgi:hypothetical protein
LQRKINLITSKEAKIMEATMKTLQITLPSADAAFLRRHSRNMGWKITTIRTPRVQEPKVEMTEEEFRAKLAHSSAQAASGHYVEKLPNETMAQFLERVCI